MRYGENPLRVIDRLKDRIKEIEPGLKITLSSGKQVSVRNVFEEKNPAPTPPSRPQRGNEE